MTESSAYFKMNLSPAAAAHVVVKNEQERVQNTALRGASGGTDLVRQYSIDSHSLCPIS